MDLSPGKIIGGIAAVGAAVAIVLWGVPYYIGAQVRTQVATELEAAGVSTSLGSLDEVSGANQATIGAVLSRLESMETRMIARDEFIMDYFKEQAERAAGN